MEQMSLNQVKGELQKIIDNHLEEWDRFSVQNLNEEQTYLVVDLISKKNDKKREEVRKKVKEKEKETAKKIKLKLNQVYKIEEELKLEKNKKIDLNNLLNEINAENYLKNNI